MVRILVDPEELQSAGETLRRAGASLLALNGQVVQAYRSLRWETQIQAGVEGEIADATSVAQALAEQAEQLAGYLARKGQAFAEADLFGEQQVGAVFQDGQALLGSKVGWTLGAAALTAIPGAVSLGALAVGLAPGLGSAVAVPWLVSKFPGLFGRKRSPGISDTKTVEIPARPEGPVQGPPVPVDHLKEPLHVEKYMQTDGRWKTVEMYGRDHSDKQTVEQLGCALMSYVMVLKYFNPNINVTPEFVDQAKVGATNYNNDMEWEGKADHFASQYGLQVHREHPADSNAAMEKAVENLREGRPTIVGIGGSKPHWIVVTGYKGPVPVPDPLRESDFLINDPVNPFDTLDQYFGKYGHNVDGVVTVSKRS